MAPVGARPGWRLAKKLESLRLRIGLLELKTIEGGVKIPRDLELLRLLEAVRSTSVAQDYGVTEEAFKVLLIEPLSLLLGSLCPDLGVLDHLISHRLIVIDLLEY